MGTVQFSHTVPQIDAAVDSIAAMQQRFGISAIVPLTKSQYDAIAEKSETTLYLVYGAQSFTLFFGELPLPSGGGGGNAGSGAMTLAARGGAGGSGTMTQPEEV